ncbi:MAG: type VII secretion protein EssC [Lachnospiraceae bacterium]|nr:type VII secretion protein EssC [Lachnospiraceae bacterium]
MSYQYKLTVHNKNIYKEFEILPDMDHVILGTTSACEFRLNPDLFFGEIEVFVEREETWSLRCSDRLFISRGDVRKLYVTELNQGDVFLICYAASGETALTLRFLIDFEAEMPRYDWKTDLSRTDRIDIGDHAESEIVLESEFGENTLAVLRTWAGQTELTEIKSRYGICVNGKRISEPVILRDSDFISIADFFAYYRDGMLYFSHQNVRTRKIDKTAVGPETDTAYPMFVRNTRIRSVCDETKMKILDPPEIPVKPDLNIVTSLMPAIAMFALVFILRGVLSTSGGSFVLFSICSMGLGVVTSAVSLVNTKRKYLEDCEERQSAYDAYIRKKRAEIEAARREERDCLREQYYDTLQDLEHLERFRPCLVDRIPEDDDFLDVYLGIGTTPARRAIDYKRQEKLEAGDDLCAIPGRLSEEYKYIPEAPVTVSLKDANAVGVVGEESGLYDMMKCMLIDLVSRQYFGDVRLYLLLPDLRESGGRCEAYGRCEPGEHFESYGCSKPGGNSHPDCRREPGGYCDPHGCCGRYGWVRLLPHIRGSIGRRNIACDSESRNAVFEELYKELTARSESKQQAGYLIIFVMDERGIKSHPVSRFIENASSLQTVFLFFEPETDLLPLHCSRIIRLQDGNRAVLFDAKNRADRKVFTYTPVPDVRLAHAVHTLAPVFCEEISLESSLRKSISLFELLGIYSAGDLDLGKRWQAAGIYDSMAVPLGVNAKDDIVYLDLHEKFHGPHGLVAGTTGSGKSEILQTFILGAATLFHPYEIGFVIIDFKGGGMVNQFRDLPHLIGAITNIDGKAINRSLKSIKAELLKRQELFAAAEVNHIDNYIKAYKSGKAETALPHLVIVVDEFAELKAEQPEFMKELISAARIGRSLGVHLILATQKPAGQVNEQIWSNSKFRLCLKVQTREDSSEVLKSPLAAEIREPGRAYLQVGNNEVFELFQSGFSGSPEKGDSGSQKSFDIYALDFKGNRTPVFRRRPQKCTGSRTQLEAIVDYVHRYCEKNGIVRLPDICPPELEHVIVCDTVKPGLAKNPEMRIAVGIYDDPDHQRQDRAAVSVGTANTLIIGSPQYGKTNLLEVFIRSLAETYMPSEIHLYIIDFASMVLKNFENLAHVGGVVCPADDEKLKNLFRYLGDQMAVRREKLLSAGVSSFISYKEAGYSDLPQIVLLIDNMTALQELYLQDNDALLTLCREGNSVGISVIMANTQTAGLGYKYTANFAVRISLFCNEPGEYTALFGSCGIRPDEAPGRCLVEVEKTLYECQTFLAFEGEREIERVRHMQEFADRVNRRNKGIRAVPIPEIPAVLTEQYIFDHFAGMKSQNRQTAGMSEEKKPVAGMSDKNTQTAGKADEEKQTAGMPYENRLILGLDYDTVAPLFLDTDKVNMLALSGADGAGMNCFIRYFIHFMLRYEGQAEVFIFDDYRKKLASLRSVSGSSGSAAEQEQISGRCDAAQEQISAQCDAVQSQIACRESVPQSRISYHVGPDKLRETLTHLDLHLQNRYRQLIAGDELPADRKILVFNTEDVYTQISSDEMLFSMLKDMVGKYRMLHIFVLFGAVPNAQITYGSPEAYKLVKETGQILFFGNLDTCRLADVPHAMLRTHRKKTGPGDAFYISGSDCFRLRTPLPANE